MLKMQDNLNLIKKISISNYNKLASKLVASERVSLVDTRNGNKTIKIIDDLNNRELFIHSKYDPIREADKFIEQNASYIEENNHIIFYGVGLAYHIEAFKKAYPDKFWSIYEPDIDIFHSLTLTRDLSRFFNRYFKFMNIETSEMDRRTFLNAYTENIHDGVAILTLPSYENIYKKKKEDFDKDFVNSLQSRRWGINVEAAFAKRWVINSLQNLLTTYQSKDVLLDYKEVFRDKPIIIASAGPSLQFEYDNLRKIKNEGLAYIFAVGSANKALIANNIYPDVVCTYDPKENNYFVFDRMNKAGIDSVPMFYGSSVGFETLMEYKGPKAHMITSQDTVSNFYLQREDGKDLEFINDAPTIAVVTLQLAIRLEVSQIYLVGQNLAYLNDLRYAEAVHEQNIELAKRQEKDINEKETVIDVYGEKIASSYGFNKMRQEMEAYISSYKHPNIYNTTKGGAAIDGAPFVSLDDVIEKELKNQVVDENWFQVKENQTYDDKYLLKKIADMDFSIRIGRRQLNEIKELLESINKNYQTANAKSLRRLLTDFDKILNKFQNLDIWKVYIERIVRVYTETINKKTHEIVTRDDFVERAKLFIEIFPAYILQIKLILEELAPMIKDNHVKLERVVSGKSAESVVNDKLENKIQSKNKLYLTSSRLMKYEGDWDTHNYLPTESKIYELGESFSSEKGAKISFRFTGTSLRIYSSKREDRSANIRLTINGKQHNISQKDTSITMTETPDVWCDLFAIDNLEDLVINSTEGEETLVSNSHLVELELLDNEIMSIMAIEIDSNAILIHPDEVSSIEELEVGKKIRCHYRANAGQVGVFSQLGVNENVVDKINNNWSESAEEFAHYNKNSSQQDNFISPKSSATPDGYFYFNMVDYDEEGRKMLIADRNIQHSISWESINNRGLVVGGKLEIDDLKIFSRLVDGGNKYMGKNNEPSNKNLNLGMWPKSNEWDTHIKKDDFNYNLEGAMSWSLNYINNLVWTRGKRVYFGETRSMSSSPGEEESSHIGYRPLIII